jgi:Cell division protein CrgA
MTTADAPTRSTGKLVAGIFLLVFGILGLLMWLGWIVTYYLSQSQYPIAALGTWNLLIGVIGLLFNLALVFVGGLLIKRSSRK